MSKNLIRLIAFSYWLIAGLLPLCITMAYFGFEIGVDGFARTYGHLFFYPLFFGFAVVSATTSAIVELRPAVQWRRQKGAVAISLIAGSLAIGTELQGNTALWEVVKPIGDSNWNEAYEKYLRLKEGVATEKLTELEIEKLKKDREELSQYIDVSIKNSPFGNPLRVAYLASFFLQVVSLAITFFAVLITYSKIHAIASDPSIDEKSILRQLDRALCFGSLWLLLRLLFLETKGRIFIEPTKPGDYFVAILYVLALLVQIGSRYKKGDRELSQFYVAMAGLAVGVFSFIGLPTRIGGLGLSDITLTWWLIIVTIIWSLVWFLDEGDLGFSDSKTSSDKVTSDK